MLLKPRIPGTPNGLLFASLFWLPGSLVALLGFGRRNRRRGAARSGNFWIVAILFLVGAGALTSCGSPSNDARPGTYSIQVTVTLGGGAVQSIDATVIVE